MVNTLDVPIRLASALLMSDAQITMAEIQSLPFVNNREEANAVAQNLMRIFGPRYRIEVASGVGHSDVRLMLDVAQPLADWNNASARPRLSLHCTPKPDGAALFSPEAAPKRFRMPATPA